MTRCILLPLALSLFCFNNLNAAEQNRLTADETSAGWKLLFDGRTLTGWHTFQKLSPPKTGWHIVDGCLVNPKSNGRPNGSGGDLVTDAKFLDFEFRFEWRMSPAGNSGVLYFVDESRQPTAPLYRGDTGHSPVGFEYQLLDDELHPDAKRGSTHKASALYDLFGTEKKILRPVGEWNESHIIVNGKHVEHWLNGAKVVECELDGDAIRDAIARSKYRVVPGFGTKIATPLCLQDHGEDVAFRNLKIRELPQH
jgi:hypothetical protein